MSSREQRNIPQLVLNYGRSAAREMVDSRDRLLVDIAAEVLADERQKIGISYTGFCLTSLPHKKIADDQIWERKGHKVTLVVEPGALRVAGKTVKFGVPFGSRARMILLYLQTEAVRTNSREVELGGSMRSWMERLGLSVGGETARALKEQAARISACSLKFFWDGEDMDSWARGGIVSAGLRFKVDQGVGCDKLWDDRVVLDEVFWRTLREHPVPLQEAAVRQLAHRSLALDVYIWLAWRCHQLKAPTPISWLALNSQFNTTGQQLKHFKPILNEAIRAATAAYPGCRVDLDERTVTIYPSKPPVLKLAC